MAKIPSKKFEYAGFPLTKEPNIHSPRLTNYKECCKKGKSDLIGVDN